MGVWGFYLLLLLFSKLFVIFFSFLMSEGLVTSGSGTTPAPAPPGLVAGQSLWFPHPRDGFDWGHGQSAWGLHGEGASLSELPATGTVSRLFLRFSWKARRAWFSLPSQGALVICPLGIKKELYRCHRTISGPAIAGHTGQSRSSPGSWGCGWDEQLLGGTAAPPVPSLSG